MKAVEQKKEMKNLIFALEPSLFEIFQNGQNRHDHMSIAFHSHITSENWQKNKRARQTKLQTSF